MCKGGSKGHHSFVLKDKKVYLDFLENLVLKVIKVTEDKLDAPEQKVHMYTVASSLSLYPNTCVYIVMLLILSIFIPFAGQAGEPGDYGSKGSSGDDGPPGEKGSHGPPGRPGNQGPQGTKGLPCAGQVSSMIVYYNVVITSV